MNQKQVRACYEKTIARFNQKMGTGYTIDNPKLFIVNRENAPRVFKEIEALTGRDTFTKSYTQEGKDFFTTSTAEAFVGDEVDAIAINSYVFKWMDEESLLFVFSHELAHIFCLHRELNGSLFADRYFKDDPDLTRVKSGHQIWKEFIADYIARQVCNRDPYVLMKIRSPLKEAAVQIDPRYPGLYDKITSYLGIIIYSEEAHMGWDHLEKTMMSCKLPYVELTGIIFNHLRDENYWLVSEEFLRSIGNTVYSDTVKAVLEAA